MRENWRHALGLRQPLGETALHPGTARATARARAEFDGQRSVAFGGLQGKPSSAVKVDPRRDRLLPRGSLSGTRGRPNESVQVWPRNRMLRHPVMAPATCASNGSDGQRLSLIQHLA